MDSKKYLRDWYDAIGFLEQIPGREKILNGAPIPMLQKDLVREIKAHRGDGTMDYRHIFTAMCVLVALDPEFPYADVYLKFLKENRDGAIRAIDRQLALALKQEEAEFAYLMARAKECIRGDVRDRLETTYAMEGIYNKNWGQGEDLSDLLKEITDRYESVIDDEPNCAEAYGALGRLFEAQALYIKAKFYDEKALALAEDDLLKEQMRMALERVEEPAAIDGAKTYLHYGKYEDAIAAIQSLDSKYTEPALCAHILGMAYYGLRDMDKAIAFLEDAASHGDDGEIENDLAIALAAAGREEEALEVLTNLLDKENDNRTALMNRGILYYREEKFSEALNDFEKAYRLASDPDLWALIEQTRELAERA